MYSPVMLEGAVVVGLSIPPCLRLARRLHTRGDRQKSLFWALVPVTLFVLGLIVEFHSYSEFKSTCIGMGYDRPGSLPFDLFFDPRYWSNVVVIAAIAAAVSLLPSLIGWWLFPALNTEERRPHGNPPEVPPDWQSVSNFFTPDSPDSSPGGTPNCERPADSGYRPSGQNRPQ